MKMNTKLNLSYYFAQPNPGLLAYLRHVEVGSTEDIRPPFWKGKSRQEVLNAWTERFDSLHVNSMMPGLEAFELEMRGKVGPLSIMLPLRDRLPKLEEYYKDVTLKSVPIDERAIRSFCNTNVRDVRVRMQNQGTTVAQMRLNTNSGAPYFTKRRNVVAHTLPRYESIPNLGPLRLPAVLGWRGQEGGPDPEDVKQRIVWMFPFGVNVLELQVYNPLIRAWQALNINPAYISNRAVEVKITKLFATKGDEYVVVTDFSGFDQHFNSDLQSAARQILTYQLNTSDSRARSDHESWLANVFPYKFEIPMVCAQSLEYSGKHGMGSGSGGTNFDECCAHGAMQHEVAILNGKRLNPYSNAYGDDGYLSYEGIDVDQVISAYTSHGQEMNPAKQSVDKHSAVYLRRYYHDSYRDKEGIMLGVYSTFRALGRLLGQERFIPFEEDSLDYARYLELRAYSILENCANSPIFNQFVDFVISGDKYRLGLDLPGFLDSLPQQVKKFTEADPGLLGYTKTLQGEALGIQNWKIVKYLRSKQ